MSVPEVSVLLSAGVQRYRTARPFSGGLALFAPLFAASLSFRHKPPSLTVSLLSQNSSARWPPFELKTRSLDLLFLTLPVYNF